MLNLSIIIRRIQLRLVGVTMLSVGLYPGHSRQKPSQIRLQIAIDLFSEADLPDLGLKLISCVFSNNFVGLPSKIGTDSYMVIPWNVVRMPRPSL